jgi:chromosome segregation ATPase
MIQAQFQALGAEIREIKQELREYIRLMSTTELEKQNLEAHVDLCSERYKGLHDRLSAIEVRLGKMNEEMTQGHKSQTKTIIATAGTVVAGLLSTVVVILMKMPG